MFYFFQRILYAVTAPLRLLLSSPGKLFSPLRRFMGISLPAKVAILLFIFLLITVPIVIIVCRKLPQAVAPEYFTKPLFLACIAILVVLIPIVAYYTLRAWLEGETSPFPDIDRAWKAGLAELERQGLDLGQTPLFLILGSAGENHEKALFGASRLNLNIKEVPQGPNPLHWYANPDAIYLVCTEAGCLSKLSHTAKEVAERESIGSPPVSPQSPAGSIRETIVAGSEDPRARRQKSGPRAPDISGPGPGETSGPAAAPQPNIRGTMITPGVAMDVQENVFEDRGAPADMTVIRLEHNEAIEQDRRLEYLCRLIRRQRQPLCPINGVLTLLPYGLIQRSVPEAIEVQRAVKRDLATMLRVLMVRCPVTALVAGMEEESGFRELVRRVGHDRAAGNRFGKGFSVSNPPLKNRLRALCAHACGSFEDWVYALFREKGSLSKPGNTKLYSLLVKVRQRVQGRLEDILAEGYGAEENPGQPTEVFMFSGCYFAATGQAEDRQAFVKAVFDKLPEQQEELQWTAAAVAEDQKYQQLAQICLGVDTLLLLLLLALGWMVFR